MLITSFDLKYMNKAVDFITKKHGFNAVIIKQKSMTIYHIQATYGNTEEWYDIEIDAGLSEPTYAILKKYELDEVA